jgi:hypothetical protein
MVLIYVLILLLLNPSPSVTRQTSNDDVFPEEFSTRALTHIVHLAGLGHRQVSTENDRHTVQYIKDQFEDMDIAVEIQPFAFESFEYTKTVFQVGNRQFDVQSLGLNPYKNRFRDKREYEGTAFLIDLNDPMIRYTQDQIEGKAVIANNWNGHFRLLPFQPELVIYVDSSTFAELESQHEIPYTLRIQGKYKMYESANIIGIVGNGNPSSKEILITAHFDTYRKNNPGASDNASGVAVMLELARYFKKIESKLNCVVKFVGFGAEEVGVVGSRNYLHSNVESLRHCELLFNIDDVGGSGPVLVEMAGGVTGIPETKCESQIPEHVQACSWEGVYSRWRMLADDNLMKIMTASNHPPWLVDVVNQSVADLGYSIRATGTQGSDQIAFAQAGIVTSGVGIISQHSHTSKDVPENINTQSLKIAAEIAAHVVLNTANRFKASNQ